MSNGVWLLSGMNNTTVEGSWFVGNTGVLTGLIVAENQETHIYILKSNFTKNLGAQRCLLKIAYGAKLRISNSNFNRNAGSKLIWATGDWVVCIVGSNFTNHFLTGGTLIYISNSNLTIRNSLFENNKQFNNGGVITGLQSKVLISQSKFINNNASVGGVFHITSGTTLHIKSSTFENISAGYGGVAYIQDSSAFISFCIFQFCSSVGNAGVLAAVNTTSLVITNCSFLSNKATYGGSISLQVNSSVELYNSLFEHNHAREGGAMKKFGAGNVSLDNCSFNNNTAPFGGSIYTLNSEILRISKGLCLQLQGTCIMIDCASLPPEQCKLYTNNFTIENRNITINSNKTKDFFNETIRNNMIQRLGKMTDPWVETPFASCKFCSFHAPVKLLCLIWKF